MSEKKAFTSSLRFNVVDSVKIAFYIYYQPLHLFTSIDLALGGMLIMSNFIECANCSSGTFRKAGGQMTSMQTRKQFFFLISIYKFSCYLPSKAIPITTPYVHCCLWMQSAVIPIDIEYVHLSCVTVAVFVMLKTVAYVFTFLPSSF